MIHPARQVPFDELYRGLQMEVERRTVTKNTSSTGDLELYHYSNSCVYDNLWNQWSLMARGLVLCPSQKMVVATPFPKFFNYGEHGRFDLPTVALDAYEKVDGSLIICFWWDGAWRTITKGSFDSVQAKWAKDQLTTLNTTVLTRGSTYLFEAVYQANRIVVRYPYEGLVLLGGYKEDGEEIPRNPLELLAMGLRCRICKIYGFGGVDEIVLASKTLDANNEGFVVRFANGYRIKIKGEEYRRIHAIISSVTPLGIWGVMAKKDNLDNIRRSIPEEFWKDFDQIKSILETSYNNLVQRIEEAYQATKYLTDKELGLSLLKLDPEVRAFIFGRRKVSGSWPDDVAFASLWRRLRPTGNKLVGYSPSTNLLGLQEE